MFTKQYMQLVSTFVQWKYQGERYRSSWHPLYACPQPNLPRRTKNWVRLARKSDKNKSNQ